jgi:hypothetical protein
VMAMVRVAVELTGPQVELLRFFADQGSQPASVRSRMYRPLCAQGLIQRESESVRYQITELGRQTVARRSPRSTKTRPVDNSSSLSVGSSSLQA